MTTPEPVPHSYEYATKIVVSNMEIDKEWTYVVVPIKSNNPQWQATVAVFDETAHFLGYI